MLEIEINRDAPILFPDQVSFASAYRLIADFAEGQEGVDPAVIAWLRASAVVNENFGCAYSEYIRSFSEFQIRQRFGDDFADNQIISLYECITSRSSYF